MMIKIDSQIKLELTAEKHAAGLYVAVNSSRKHLSEFLSWVDNMQSVDDFRAYIQDCESLFQQKKEVSFVIMSDEVIVGRIGLHHLNLNSKNAAIGYWLTENALGKGIIIRSCMALTDYGFRELGLQRIEIKAATGNHKSQAIPQKLGFQKEGVLRQADIAGGKFLDLVMYSMLREEWEAKTW